MPGPPKVTTSADVERMKARCGGLRTTSGSHQFGLGRQAPKVLSSSLPSVSDRRRRPRNAQRILATMRRV